MAIAIALLRGVNLGATRRVAMTNVRAAIQTLGYRQVRSLLQSGNLVFDAGGDDEAAIETRTESALLERLSLTTEVVVRSVADWRAMIAVNPFPGEAAADPAHLVAMVMKSAPPANAEAAVNSLGRAGERARLIGREAFVVYPRGIADSRLVGARLDAALGARGTGRNWNTVLKLAELADEGASS